MKNFLANWLKPIAWVFIAGVFLVGPLDLFHTCKGVQTYLIRRALTPQCNWPWYIPFQMGLAGVFILVGWVAFKRSLSGRFKRRDSRFEGETGFLIPLAILLEALGYFLGYYLVDSPSHINFYLFFWIGSIFFLALSQRKVYILAFITIGVIGILGESVLLDPAVGYFRYTQHDLLGRAPAWLLFSYGWAGVFIQEVSKKLE